MSTVVKLIPRTASATTAERPDSPAPVGRLVYTVKEVAEMLALNLGGTYHLIRSGNIPAIKLGGRWAIPKGRFHAWLDNLPEATDNDVAAALDRLDCPDASAAASQLRHGT